MSGTFHVLSFSGPLVLKRNIFKWPHPIFTMFTVLWLSYLKSFWPFIWTNLNFLYLQMTCTIFNWNFRRNHLCLQLFYMCIFSTFFLFTLPIYLYWYVLWVFATHQWPSKRRPHPFWFWRRFFFSMSVYFHFFFFGFIFIWTKSEQTFPSLQRQFVSSLNWLSGCGDEEEKVKDRQTVSGQQAVKKSYLSFNSGELKILQ
jgi:hypothetical protein